MTDNSASVRGQTAAGNDLLGVARAALRSEADAIEAVAERLDGAFLRAVDLIGRHDGKVVLTGVGKSGHVAQKIAGTLCSTGTPAVFIHATDAVHGDLGRYSLGDPTILISKSGSTAEVLRLVSILQQAKSCLIAIVGNRQSPLAKLADVVLDASVRREADPLNLAPTCSSTAALAVGDALSVALMQAKAFTDEDFARRHPAGQLGRNILSTVQDFMHHGDEVAWVEPESSLRDVIVAMTECPLGAACVVSSGRELVGLITDGDLRRALLRRQDVLLLQARDVLTARPVTVSPRASLRDAVTLMEDRPSQLSVLPVVEPATDRCLGLLRIHDIYQAELV